MTKTFIALSLLLSASAFGLGRAPAPQPSPTPVTSPSVTPSVTPSPVLSDRTPRITVRNVTGATAAEQVLLTHGVSLANGMITKPCFVQWVLAAKYTENQGLTQAQILKKIQTEPTTVDVEVYYANNGTVGFEYDPWDGVVHMNRKFVRTAYDFGDNLIHEDRGHSLTFRHDFKHSTSVPYGMNYAYEGCSQQNQMKGDKVFKPKGLRIEVRKRHHKPSAEKKKAA